MARYTLINRSSIPLRKLQAVLRHVAPPTLRGHVTITVWDSDDECLRGLAHGEKRWVRLWVPSGAAFPRLDRPAKDGNLGWGTLRSQAEALVCVLAHELQHLVQWQRAWSFNERHADLAAIRQHKRWRRLQAARRARAC